MTCLASASGITIALAASQRTISGKQMAFRAVVGQGLGNDENMTVFAEGIKGLMELIKSGMAGASVYYWRYKGGLGNRSVGD